MVDKKQTRTPDGESSHRCDYNDFADRIISQIKAGTAPWQKPWKSARLAAGSQQKERGPDQKPEQGPSPHTRG